MTFAALPNYAAFEEWLNAQVLQLAVDSLKFNTFTCTACNEVLGTYIVDYKGEKFRCTPEEAYAFLKFLTEQPN